MRPIKFRAWYIGQKKMYRSDQIQLLICSGELREYRIFEGGSDVMTFLGNDKHFDIMQFTGLLDKNGTEIYEGDIVRSLMFKNKDGKEYYSNILMEWREQEGSDDMGVDMVGFLWVGGEVIGNIYENPDIIKGK